MTDLGRAPVLTSFLTSSLTVFYAGLGAAAAGLRAASDDVPAGLRAAPDDVPAGLRVSPDDAPAELRVSSCAAPDQFPAQQEALRAQDQMEAETGPQHLTWPT
jgi:hypothetical protein